MTLEMFTAVLGVLLLMSLVYIFTNKRLQRPVGGLIINLEKDGLTARVGVALYDDYAISDLVTRDYVVLRIDRDFDLSSLASTDESHH